MMDFLSLSGIWTHDDSSTYPIQTNVISILRFTCKVSKTGFHATVAKVSQWSPRKLSHKAAKIATTQRDLLPFPLILSRTDKPGIDSAQLIRYYFANSRNLLSRKRRSGSCWVRARACR